MTDVVLSVLSDAPCVKGGAGLFGSISSIEGVAPCLLSREVCTVVSWHTCTQTAVTHMSL